jgi:integrase
MRPEEVFRMRIESIDFKQKTIFNPFGKTKAARRTIPMTDDVACLLKARIKKLELNNTTPQIGRQGTQRPEQATRFWR